MTTKGDDNFKIEKPIKNDININFRKVTRTQVKIGR